MLGTYSLKEENMLAIICIIVVAPVVLPIIGAIIDAVSDKRFLDELGID